VGGDDRGTKLSVEYSREVDAMFTWLRRGVERAFGKKLEDSRYIDYGANGAPTKHETT
jgi:hypothetical protein